MKKLILLPVVLATCGFVLLSTNSHAVETKAESTESSLTLTVKDAISNIKPSGSMEVLDIDTDLVKYSIRAGNPETGVYNTLKSTHEWNHDLAVDADNSKDGVDWDGARMHAVPGNYVMLGFQAKDDITVRMHGGQPWGNSQDSYIKYYIANANFDYDQSLTAVHSAYRQAEGKWTPADLEYTTTLKAGETIVWAWGGSKLWANLQTLENLSITFTYVPEQSKTSSLTSWHFFTDTIGNDGADKENDLAAYGMRFGLPTKENPFNENATVDGNKFVTDTGLNHEWWKLCTNKDSGFAFSLVAKTRITVSVDFKGYNSFYSTYGGNGVVTISYLIVRDNKIIDTVYTNNQMTGNFATDEALLETSSFIELAPRDQLLVGFNASVTPDGDPFNLMLGTDENLTVNVSNVLLSKEAKLLVNKWIGLRSSNNNDLCDLTGRNAETLNNLIDAYYLLSSPEQEIVGRTRDVDGFTIAEGINYFATANASSSSLILPRLEDNQIILIVSIACSFAALLIAGIILKKKRNTI